MKTRAWNGNVRELENAIERAVTMNASGEILPEDMMQFGLPSQETEPPKPEMAAPREIIAVVDDAEPVSLDEMTRRHIVRVMQYTSGNKLRAAQLLGVGRWSLYRMAERLGVNLDELTYDTPPKRQKR